jgi:cell envelope opacity-associated protein A
LIAIQDGFHLENLTWWTVSSATEALEKYQLAMTRKAMAGHNLNDTSSRSHVLVQVAVTTFPTEVPEESTISYLTVVDLAGFERPKQTGTASSAKSYAEGVAINKSLMTLRQVITALAKHTGQQQEGSAVTPASSTQGPPKPSTPAKSRTPPATHKQHVPFRDSKLTSLLKESLGGSSRLTLIACIHDRPEFSDENLSTLQYATLVRTPQFVLSVASVP